MGLFNFDKDCYVCKCHRNRKAVVLNLLFSPSTCNNIVSYLSCYKCSELTQCELEYEKEKYRDYCREAKLFNFIYNHLDTKYNKLKTLKDKKIYMKELIRRSESCKKGMLVKFVNDTYYLKGFDEYKQWFSQSCPIPEYYFFDDSDLEDEFCYRNDEMLVCDVFKNYVLSIHTTSC